MEIDGASLKKTGKPIYFMGIAGTGMSAVAGYFRKLGYHVCGSDEGLYPPVSTMLAALNIPLLQGFDAENINKADPQLVVVGNKVNKHNPEYIYAKERVAVVHFPRLIQQYLQATKKTSIVVAGTHGKTTTTSLLAHVLRELGDAPSYLIGGVPQGGEMSFHVGSGKLMCLEGDEYSCSLYDGEPKFFYYLPEYLLINAIEWDHADIYPDLSSLMEKFEKLIAMVADPHKIVANIDCPQVASLLDKLGIMEQVKKVSPYRKQPKADVQILAYPPTAEELALRTSDGEFSLKTALTGDYNAANIAMVTGVLLAMGKKIDEDFIRGIASFKGVKKRLQHLFGIEDVDCYLDFAHHPTAVRKVLRNVSMMHPGRRVVAVFELKSASSVRNIFFERYVESLKNADYLALLHVPTRKLPAAISMDVGSLAESIGEHAHYFSDIESMGRRVLEELRPGDVLLLMSCGDFGNLPQAAERWVSRGWHHEDASIENVFGKKESLLMCLT